MEIKLFLFVILLFASTGRMKTAQANEDVVFYAGVYFVAPVPVACNGKNSKGSFLAVMGAGGEGEERLVVQRIEYDSRVCHVSPPPPLETVIDINQTPQQTTPTTPDVGEEHVHSSRKFDGGGPGGGGPGGGGDDPDGGGPDFGADNNFGDNDQNEDVGEILSESQREKLKKLAKISISIAAQTGISLVALPRDKPTFAVYSVVVICICAYFFCYLSIISNNRSAAAITGAIGTTLAAVGFLLAMSVVVLPFSVWAFVLSSVLLIVSIVIFFIIK